MPAVSSAVKDVDVVMSLVRVYIRNATVTSPEALMDDAVIVSEEGAVHQHLLYYYVDVLSLDT